MATIKKQTASKKELTIVAVYKFKTNGKLNGTVCTLIRSSKVVKGETVITEHKVWTHANGCAPHCDCDGFEKSHGKRQCGHIKLVEAREPARQVVVAESVATPATPVVVEPVSTVQPVVETTATKEVAKPAASGREMSSIESSMPAWMLTGRSSNGTFAGRGAQQEEQERIALRDSLQATAPHNKFSWKYVSKTA